MNPLTCLVIFTFGYATGTLSESIIKRWYQWRLARHRPNIIETFSELEEIHNQAIVNISAPFNDERPRPHPVSKDARIGDFVMKNADGVWAPIPKNTKLNDVAGICLIETNDEGKGKILIQGAIDVDSGKHVTIKDHDRFKPNFPKI